MVSTFVGSVEMKRGRRLLCAALLLGLPLLLLTPVFKGSASPDEMPFQIMSVTLRDENGNPITQTVRGRFVFVDVVVKNVETYAYESKPFLLIASLRYGAPPRQLGLSGYRGSLAAGEQANPTPGFQIPSDGPIGTYTVRVMVFSNWPALGGSVAAVPMEKSLVVG